MPKKMKSLFRLQKKDFFLLIILVLLIALSFVINDINLSGKSDLYTKYDIVNLVRKHLCDYNMRDCNTECGAIVPLSEKQMIIILADKKHHLSLGVSFCLAYIYQSEKYETSEIAFEANKKLISNVIFTYFSEYPANLILPPYVDYTCKSVRNEGDLKLDDTICTKHNASGQNKDEKIVFKSGEYRKIFNKRISDVRLGLLKTIHKQGYYFVTDVYITSYLIQ
jgi:hypothetical protein